MEEVDVPHQESDGSSEEATVESEHETRDVSFQRLAGGDPQGQPPGLTADLAEGLHPLGRGASRLQNSQGGKGALDLHPLFDFMGKDMEDTAGGEGSGQSQLSTVVGFGAAGGGPGTALVGWDLGQNLSGALRGEQGGEGAGWKTNQAGLSREEEARVGREDLPLFSGRRAGSHAPGLDRLAMGGSSLVPYDRGQTGIGRSEGGGGGGGAMGAPSEYLRRSEGAVGGDGSFRIPSPSTVQELQQWLLKSSAASTQPVPPQGGGDTNTSLGLMDPWMMGRSQRVILDSLGQPRSYSCAFCGRVFTNSQALGGHQNAHKRERMMSMKRPRLQDSEPEAGPFPGLSTSPPIAIGSSRRDAQQRPGALSGLPTARHASSEPWGQTPGHSTAMASAISLPSAPLQNVTLPIEDVAAFVSSMETQQPNLLMSLILLQQQAQTAQQQQQQQSQQAQQANLASALLAQRDPSLDRPPRAIQILNLNSAAEGEEVEQLPPAQRAINLEDRFGIMRTNQQQQHQAPGEWSLDSGAHMERGGGGGLGEIRLRLGRC